MENTNLDNVIVSSPLTGFIIPIEDVPDPVFAQKMVGDGLAIDPTSNKLFSPANGKVLQLHSSKHAVTLLLEDGTELLMHIGIDTVNLKGKGFKALVEVGDQVERGAPLIEFDMDYLALNAKSLITPILITNIADKKFSLELSSGSVERGRSIINIQGGQLNTTKENKSDITAKSDLIKIEFASGLHARPSAQVAALAKRFRSDITLSVNNATANVKSVVSILSLEIKKNDQVQFEAQGDDANEAVLALVDIIKNGIEEETEVKEVAPVVTAQSDDSNLAGMVASPGIAIGKVYQVGNEDIDVVMQTANPAEETKKVEQAINKAKLELEDIRQKLESDGHADRGAIFGAHQELLDDPDLIDTCFKIINENKNAEYAWKSAYTEFAGRLSGLKNELFAARANDILDVGKRVLKILVGSEVCSLDTANIPENVILIAESLTPSDTANLDKNKVLGFATTTGGTTSHVAILARSLDIPALAGIDARALEIANGTEVILDGDHGVLKLGITEKDRSLFNQRHLSAQNEKKEALTQTFKPAYTTDGIQIEVGANIGGTSDAETAMEFGCDGVGLLRSEFLFLERSEAPTEKDQTMTYQNMADILSNSEGHKPLIIRTLDVGGDKPLSYLPIPQEENPFLGERGIRVSLNNPEIFKAQVRAILKVSPLDQIKIMFPMVSSLDELLEAKRIVREEEAKLKVGPVSIGIMIEVPSAALTADALAPHVDFFSVGANDLTQYVMAIDRGHAKLAAKADGLHPAVLKLIKFTCDAAKKHGKWVGVCGGIASDLQAVPFLIGLGVTELSVSVPVLPMVKATIRKYSLKECESLADKALLAIDAKSVRALKA